MYLRPAVDAGAAEGKVLEKEMGKGEELMMTKRDFSRTWVLNSGRPIYPFEYCYLTQLAG